MGSTATGSKAKKAPVKKKKDSARKKSARKTTSKKIKSPDKSVKKKAAKPKKTVGKKSAARKKTARKKSAAKAGKKAASKPAKKKHVTPVTGTTTRRPGKAAMDTTMEDSKSLSWMAAQAASALKAVRANQSERAQTLLAKTEITPSTPVAPRKQTKSTLQAVPSNVKQDASADSASIPASNISQPPEKKQDANPTSKPASARTGVIKSATSKTPETKTTPASIAVKQAVIEVSGDTATAQPAPPTPLSDKPDAMKATAARDNAAVRVDAMEKTQEKQTEVPPVQVAAQVAAAISTPGSNRRPTRPMLLAGIIIFVGILVARTWFSDDNTVDIAAIQGNSKAEQTSPTTGKSAQEAIAAVTGKPVARAAATNTQTDNWSPTARPGWPTPAVRQQPLQPADRNNTGAMTGKQAAAGSRRVPAPQQHTGVAPQVSRPVAPQPGYYYPAYGYNPQQPVAPQPYYRPTYSRPSYLQ